MDKLKYDYQRAQIQQMSDTKERQKRLDELDAKYKDAQIKKMEADSKAKLKASGKKVTDAQKKVDQEFAKEYVDFVASGGYADTQKQLDQLREVSKLLGDKATATGPIVGVLPKGVRDIVTPEGAAMQDKVEEVVQRNLRLVLGAQFTEKEGERLIARAYNPRLSEEENKRRVDALINQIDKAAKAKQRAAEYYEKNGTLIGFKGKIYKTADDFSQVKVRLPDGRVGIIPIERLNDALAKGAVQVED